MGDKSQPTSGKETNRARKTMQINNTQAREKNYATGRHLYWSSYIDFHPS